MNNEIQLLLERVKLPPLSFDLLHKLGDVDCDLESIAASISLDPSLTARLLRICNTAVFGSSEPVGTVAEAIARAGFKSVYMLAATLYGNGCYSGFTMAALDPQRLWQHCVATAFNAKFVAETAGLDANSLFTAGLLHDIGKVILAQAGGSPTGNFYAPTDKASLGQESNFFGLDHAEVGARLLEKWKLPAQLVTAVRHHHCPTEAADFQEIVAAVTIGNVLSHVTDHPEIIASETYVDALCILDLNPTHLKLWRERFDDSSELVATLGGLGESNAQSLQMMQVVGH